MRTLPTTSCFWWCSECFGENWRAPTKSLSSIAMKVGPGCLVNPSWVFFSCWWELSSGCLRVQTATLLPSSMTQTLPWQSSPIVFCIWSWEVRMSFVLVFIWSVCVRECVCVHACYNTRQCRAFWGEPEQTLSDVPSGQHSTQRRAKMQCKRAMWNLRGSWSFWWWTWRSTHDVGLLMGHIPLPCIISAVKFIYMYNTHGKRSAVQSQCRG